MSKKILGFSPNKKGLKPTMVDGWGSPIHELKLVASLSKLVASQNWVKIPQIIHI